MAYPLPGQACCLIVDAERGEVCDSKGEELCPNAVRAGWLQHGTEGFVSQFTSVLSPFLGPLPSIPWGTGKYVARWLVTT